MEEMILNMLGQYGVPSVICAFLLIKGCNSIDAMTKAVRELDHSIVRMEAAVDQLARLALHQHHQ